MAVLSLKQVELNIKLEASMMKMKYPSRYHAQIELNLSSAIELVKRNGGAVAELDVSDELRFRLPTLPIRKRDSGPRRKSKVLRKGGRSAGRS
jgi:hypothetical protein